MQKNGFSRFLGELQRRSVFRVGVAYAVFAAAVIQLSDVVIPRMGGTDRTVELVIRIALIGFPVALVLAWVFDITTDGVETTGSIEGAESSQLSKRSRLRRRMVATGMLALTGVAVFVSARTIRHRAIASAFDPDRFAVLPFHVQGRADIRYLDEAVVDLLSLKLSGAGQLFPVEPKPLLGFIHRSYKDTDDDVAVGRRVSRQFRAGLFIAGSVVQAGDKLQLTASLYNHDGDVLVDHASTLCAEDELSAGLDDLSRQLMSAASITGGAPVATLAQYTTDSLPALKAYLRGERFMREGSTKAAVAELEKAVAIDTTFGLAYYRLILAQSWMPRTSPEFARTDVTLEHIAQHLDQMSPRNRLEAETWIYMQYGSLAQAAQSAGNVLEREPENVEALYILSELRFHWPAPMGVSMSTTKETLGRLLSVDPNHPFALEHMADIAAIDRDTIALDTLAAKIEKHLADRGPFYRILLAVARDPARAATIVPSALTKMSDQDVFDFLWRALALFPEAEIVRAAAVALSEPQRSPRMHERAEQYRAADDVLHGRVAKGVKRIKAGMASATDPQVERTWHAFAITVMLMFPTTRNEFRDNYTPYSPARLEHEMAQTGGGDGTGRIAAFEGILLSNPQPAARVRALLTVAHDTRTGFLANTRANQGVEARRELIVLDVFEAYVAGNCAPTMQHVNEAETEWTTLMRADCLGRAGNEDAALSYYTTMPSYFPTVMYAISTAPIAALRMAEIHDRAGRTDMAKAQYARFLSFWEGTADAALQPDVGRARKRFNVLAAGR